MAIDSEHILKTAIHAAWKAGQLALAEQHRAQVEYKAGDQIVTQVDRKCQAMILETISQTFPEHGIIAEETEDGKGKLFHQSPRDDRQSWWVIDPIDGTRNYAHGIGLFAVSIGVIQNGNPCCGAIYDPSRDLMFTGILGGKARCNQRELRCIDEVLHSDSQLGVPGHHHHGLPPFVHELMSRYVCMSIGSAALHYAFVAMGAYSAAMSYEVSLWDIAAGAAIANAAGATITDIDGNPRFPFDCQGYRGQPVSVVMGHPHVHRQLMALLGSGCNA